MTQGEILSSFAHIDTLIKMCEERRSESNYLSIIDLRYMEPFVTKAEAVAMKLSEYAFEHFNSNDKQKKELSDIICRHFLWHESFVLSPDFKVNEESYCPSDIRNLVYHIKNVKTILQNTYEACGQLAKAPEDDKTIAELKKHVEKLTEENERLKEQLEQQQKADNQDYVSQLEEEIESLKAELKSISPLTAKRAAILTITACYYAGGWKNRQNLHPILTNLLGIPEAHAKRRLRESIREADAEELAKCFDDVSPMIARILREIPEKLKSGKKN